MNGLKNEIDGFIEKGYELKEENELLTDKVGFYEMIAPNLPILFKREQEVERIYSEIESQYTEEYNGDHFRVDLAEFRILDKYNLLPAFMEKSEEKLFFKDNQGEEISARIHWIKELWDTNDPNSRSSISIGVEIPEKQKQYDLYEFDRLYGDVLNKENNKYITMENRNINSKIDDKEEKLGSLKQTQKHSVDKDESISSSNGVKKNNRQSEKGIELDF